MPSFREIAEREVILANGARVRLQEAAARYGILTTYAGDQGGGGVLHLVREKCLGKPLGDAGVQSLRDRGLLEADGTIDPIMKDVVLSSVRGDGHALHLSSPFTDPLDRAVEGLLHAFDVINVELGEQDSRQFLTDALARHTRFDQAVGGWAKKSARSPLPPDGDSPPPRR